MFDLSRFITAQDQPWDGYDTALSQIRRGHKSSHWIWYIFPQLEALGKSGTARYYGISGLEEAQAYAAHPVLGARLRQIAQAALDQPENDPGILMGSGIDRSKLRSCMTLFELADPGCDVYSRVLERFYQGRRCRLTLSLLKTE